MSGPRPIRRLSLDLETEQHSFAKLFALKNDINVSVVMRAMLFRLETDPVFANEIIDLIFSVPEEEVVEEDFEEEAAIPTTNKVTLADLQSGDYQFFDAQGNKIVVE